MLTSLENIEVYNIICDSIGIEPKSNNGSLRLPLKPVGLHSDKSTDADDTPVDFISDEASSMESENSKASEAKNPAGSEMTVIEEDPVTGEFKETKVEMNNFWEYVKAKMAAAQSWAKNVLASLKGNHQKAGDQSKSFDQGDTPNS